jgi:membrane-bound serine protease (ClpP class)
VDDAQGLLTVGAADALAMKLSRATIDDTEKLRIALNVRSAPLVLGFNWAERTTVFLSTWPMRLLLFAAMLVFGWIEISHPGISFAGITAFICLVLLVGAPFLTGLAQVWEIALIVLGLAIIIGDLVIFGGLGMLAIPGFILMAVGLVASFVPIEPGGGFAPSSTTWAALERGLGVLVGGCFLALGTFFLLSRYLYITPGFNRLQLAPSGVSPKSAGTGLGTTDVRDALDRPAADAVFLGAIGITTTDLRPAGKARFGDHLVSVVSDGLYIPLRQEVEVIELTPMRIVVKRYTPPPGAGVSLGDLPPLSGDGPPAGGASA